MDKKKVSQEKLNDALQIILRHLQDNSGEANIEYLKEATVALVQKKPLPVEHIPNNKPANKGVPDEHIIPNNKLANSLTDEDSFSLSGFDMRVSRRGAKREIKNATVISYEGADNIAISSKKPYTEYDRQVHDAVVSLFADGADSITPAMIYRAMNGSRSDDGISQKVLKSIEASVTKMRFINIDIDVAQEVQQRGITDADGFPIVGGHMKGNLLYILEIEYEYQNANGIGHATGYKLKAEPILYSYSRMTGQLATVPSVLLAIQDENGQELRNNEQRIVIKGYLLRRIAVMKGKTSQSNRILLSKIYGLFDSTKDRKKLQRYKEYAVAVLSFWKRKNFISGFEIVKKRGADFAIDIYF